MEKLLENMIQNTVVLEGNTESLFRYRINLFHLLSLLDPDSNKKTTKEFCLFLVANCIKYYIYVFKLSKTQIEIEYNESIKFKIDYDQAIDIINNTQIKERIYVCSLGDHLNIPILVQILYLLEIIDIKFGYTFEELANTYNKIK